MNRERTLEVVLTMLGAVLLLIASVGKYPYGFYMVLRLVITVGAAYWAWRVFKTGLRTWTWAFVAVALLMNPFLPIRMQRTQWQPIDLWLGILFIGWSVYWLFRSNDAQNAIKAARLRTAAEQGDAKAQFKLGLLYFKGESVPKDYAQAVFWLNKAAKQGHALAQYNLDRNYTLLCWLKDNEAEATASYRKAAEQGDAESQLILGAIYHKGQDVPQDYSEAYFWSDIAAAGKLDAPLAKVAAKSRDEAASHLTPADLSREQERARKWFEAHQAKSQ